MTDHSVTPTPTTPKPKPTTDSFTPHITHSVTTKLTTPKPTTKLHKTTSKPNVPKLTFPTLPPLDKTTTKPSVPESTEAANLTSPDAQARVSQAGGLDHLSVGIVIILILTCIAAVIFTGIVIFRFRKTIRSRGQVPHQRFQDEVIAESTNGSLSMQNPMYETNGHMEIQPQVQVDTNGSVLFSKTPQEGISNPLYESSQNSRQAETCLDTNGVDLKWPEPSGQSFT